MSIQPTQPVDFMDEIRDKSSSERIWFFSPKSLVDHIDECLAIALKAPAGSPVREMFGDPGRGGRLERRARRRRSG